MDVVITVMKDQGRSQAWLAKRLNVHPMTLNYWFRKKRKMPDKYKPLIAMVLGFPEIILFPDG